LDTSGTPRRYFDIPLKHGEESAAAVPSANDSLVAFATSADRVYEGPTHVWRPKVSFHLAGLDGVRRVSFGPFPDSEGETPQKGWYRSVGFGRVTGFVLSGPRVFVGTGEAYEIMAFDLEGRLISRIRRRFDAQPVTDADRAWYMRRQSNPETRRLPPPRVADSFPPYVRFLGDNRGRLWVAAPRRPDAPTVEWSVFSGAGRWLCTIQTPATFEPMEIGADRMIGPVFTSVDRWEVVGVGVLPIRPPPTA
jgi:hypothetical protein